MNINVRQVTSELYREGLSCNVFIIGVGRLGEAV